MGFIKKNWYWIIPLVLGIVVYAVLMRSAKKSAKQKVPAVVDLDRETVLYQGIKNKSLEVAELQKYLNKSANPKLEIDGDFGPKTAQELYRQKKVWQTSLKNLGI